MQNDEDLGTPRDAVDFVFRSAMLSTPFVRASNIPSDPYTKFPPSLKFVSDFLKHKYPIPSFNPKVDYIKGASSQTDRYLSRQVQAEHSLLADMGYKEAILLQQYLMEQFSCAETDSKFRKDHPEFEEYVRIRKNTRKTMISASAQEKHENAQSNLLRYNRNTRNQVLSEMKGYTEADLQQYEFQRAQKALEQGIHHVVDNTGKVNMGAGGSKLVYSLTQNKFRLDQLYKENEGDDELFGLTLYSSDDAETASVEDEEEQGRKALITENQKEDLEIEFDEIDSQLNGILSLDTSMNKNAPPMDKGKKFFNAHVNQKEFQWAEEDDLVITKEAFEVAVPVQAREYPFDLDNFQKRAVMRLENSENIFVAAHTSAGKTVVAEYAIALSQIHKTKTIYTSPIKTLSNQKYRDFSETFEDVGIVTGDISIRPEASCLIMTTEILRSMLYKGADVIRDVEWIVFDEVHYVNDAERGVVWEEVIILLPPSIGIVMLSATVPNALEFAEWVGRTRKSKVYVIATSKRPVPLEHSIFMKNKLHTIVDSCAPKKFLSLNYSGVKKLEAEILQKAGKASPQQQNWRNLVTFLTKEERTPTVVFIFSRKKCEEAADSLNNLDLSEGATVKSEIHMLFESAISRLSKVDRSVPQILRMREMLKRGVGVHHAGLLPLVKEITEILFQKGYIKILFATETFAMGVNMPARSVVFPSLRKHDGRETRYLEPGEYTQMAGRAGRRGLDSVGNVILYFVPGGIPPELDMKRILTGLPHRLKSKFRLTYTMILNIFRVEDIRVEDVIRRSFSEAPAERDTEKMSKLIKAGQKTLNQIESKSQDFSKFEMHYNLFSSANYITQDISSYLMKLYHIFVKGRLIVLKRIDYGLSLAMVLRAPKKSNEAEGLVLSSFSDSGLAGKADASVKVFVLVCGAEPERSPYYMRTENLEGKYSKVADLFYEIRDVAPNEIISVTNNQMKVDVLGLLPVRGQPDPDKAFAVGQYIQRFAEGKEELKVANPETDFSVKDLDFVEAWAKRENILAQMRECPTYGHPNLRKPFKLLERRERLQMKMERLQWALSDDSLELMPDYYKRVEVLKALQYISADDIIQLKGRAACEVNSAESIVIVELILDNLFEKLTPEESAAALSCFIFQERTDFPVEMNKTLEDARDRILDVVEKLGVLQADIGIPISPIDYCRTTAQFGLVQVVYQWAHQAAFKDICVITDVQEGSIVRYITRLSELIREVRNVASIIGNVELYKKMEAANDCIKRDIIFASSLYLD